MKKIIIKLTLMALIFTIAVPVAFASSLNRFPSLSINKPVILDNLLQDNGFIKEMKTYLINEYGANYEEVLELNARSAENANKIKNLFPINRIGASEVRFPEYIGGLYINDDNNLVITIVKEALPNEKTAQYSVYMNTLAIDSNAIIEYVKYSHTEIYKVYDALVNYSMDNLTTSNVNAVYVDDFNNSVVVELKKYTKEEIAKFKEAIMDSPIITFKEGEVALRTAAAPGQAAAGLCSIGYRAKSNGVEGFVFTGHSIGVGITISGIGIVELTQTSGNADAGWIRTSTTTSNNFYTSIPLGAANLSTTIASSFTAGQMLGKLGKTSGYSNGKVKSASYAPAGLTSQVDTELNAKPGDSGGIVFVSTPVSGIPGGHATAGVVAGCRSTDGVNCNVGSMYFSKASVINNNWSLTRY